MKCRRNKLRRKNLKVRLKLKLKLKLSPRSWYQNPPAPIQNQPTPLCHLTPLPPRQIVSIARQLQWNVLLLVFLDATEMEQEATAASEETETKEEKQTSHVESSDTKPPNTSKTDEKRRSSDSMTYYCSINRLIV